MTRFGYVQGSNADQSAKQYSALIASGFDFDGGIAIDVPWGQFIQEVERGDEVIVCSDNRLSRDPVEAKARKEMLEIIGATILTLEDALNNK